MKRLLMTVVAAAAMASAPVAAFAQTTLDVWHVINIDKDMVHDGIKSFNEIDPDVQAEERIVPFAQLEPELLKAIATGDVPDAVMLASNSVPAFVVGNALMDLTDRVAASDKVNGEDYHPGPWNSAQWDGKVYAVPRAANTLALYYNKDLLDEKGISVESLGTWSGLISAAEALTVPGERFGLAFSAIATEEGTFQFLPWLWQAGADIDTLDTPEAASALQVWVDLVKNGYSSKDVLTMRQFEGTSTFMAKNAALVISGPWELPRIEKDAKFNWGVRTLPVKDGVNIEASALGDYNWVIPTGAKDPDASFKFIEYMTSEDVVKNAWDSGRLSARADIDVLVNQWPEAFATFNEQMKSARQRGPDPKYGEKSRVIQKAIQQAMTEELTVEAALAEAAAAIAKIK